MTTHPAPILTPQSMRRFYTIWFGQLISTLGSSMTSFSLGIWLFRETGSVTVVGVVFAAYVGAMALASLVAGAFVDRHDRRTVMMLADTAQALSTLLIGLLLVAGWFQFWMAALMIAVSGAAQSFQGPAWSASIPMLVPKAQLGRAAGLGRLNQAVGRLVAPALAGALLVTVDLGGIILIDFATFLVAIAILALSPIPNPPRRSEEVARPSVVQEIRFGWSYLLQREGLFALVMIISLLNLFLNFATILQAPMMLTFTNEAVIGLMASIASSGMLLATVLMSAWGGPKRGRVPLILGMIMLQGAVIFLMGVRPSVILLTLCSFLMMFGFGIIGTNTGPIYQTKVALDVQGRVFATVGFLATVLEPIGELLVGPLTDRILEPAMAERGQLAPWLGPLIGVGPGRGMAVVFLAMGLLIIGLGVYGFLNPRVRLLEDELPDALPDPHREEHPMRDTERAAVAG